MFFWPGPSLRFSTRGSFGITHPSLARLGEHCSGLRLLALAVKKAPGGGVSMRPCGCWQVIKRRGYRNARRWLR